MMEAFGFVNTELSGYEADDVIGTLARRAEAGDEPVVILTGDRDAFQLVSPRVSVHGDRARRHRHDRLHARRGAWSATASAPS